MWIYDSKLRTKVKFNPRDPSAIRVYGCGPTVYDRIHVGNARSFVTYDVLFRILRHVYGSQQVTFVRNITDVDDKINDAAQRRSTSIEEITTNTIQAFHDDLAELNVLSPTVEPRATEHICDMISMISKLIAQGNAYESQGQVFFAVSSFEGYGEISGRDLSLMRSGARVEVSEIKRDPLDFVLWKPSDTGTPGWDSPWGYGRPGWHIECSAMAARYLGHEFDIHTGGSDLIFPHHENEAAQSRCAHSTSTMANHWLHVAFVQFDDDKMSKSTGNVVTVADALALAPGDALRLALISSHYRHPLAWTSALLQDSYRTLQRWCKLISEIPATDLASNSPDSSANPVEVIDALLDDLSTPKAIAALHAYAKEASLGCEQARLKLSNGAKFLGIYPHGPRWNRWHQDKQSVNELLIESEAVDQLVKLRTQARENKDFSKADEIRKQLAQNGIVLHDHDEGTSWHRQ